MHIDPSLLTNVYQWVSWITCIDTGQPWPTVWVCALTHGNEIGWLQALQHLLETNVPERLISGRLILITVNHAAYNDYIASADPVAGRFHDINMNRVRAHLDQTDAYEVQRYHRLLPIFDQIDYILDIHTTSQPENSRMGICHTRDHELLDSFICTDRILCDPNFDTASSMISYLSAQGKVAYGIECGSHTQSNAYLNAYENILALLGHTWQLPPSTQPKQKTPKGVFQFYSEVYPLTEQFSYTRSYQNFDQIAPGERFATDQDTSYINETEDDLYLGIIGRTVRPGDGIGFLFTKLG